MNVGWTESDELTEVLLHEPGPETEGENPGAKLFASHFNWRLAKEEHQTLVKTFQGQGVRVRRVAAPSGCREANLMYVRDQFVAVNRSTAIVGTMHSFRSGETAVAERNLDLLGYDVIRLTEETTFEGADFLRASPTLILVGIGNRTNDVAFNQLRDLFDPSIDVVSLELPKRLVPQHLLGYVQILGQNKIAVRSELIPNAERVMRELGWEVISIPEDREVTSGGAMNFVNLGSGRIILAAGCPMMASRLSHAGMTIVAEIPCSELLHGGGGFACLTGILSRTSAAHDD